MIFLPHASPDTPSPYHLAAAGSDRRWWRPLLGMLVGGVTAMVLIFLVTIGMVVTGDGAMMADGAALPLDRPGPIFWLASSLAVLIPAVIVASLVGFRTRPGFVMSVAGRIRWRWLATCLAIALVPYGVLVAGERVLTTGIHPHVTGQTVLVIAVILVMIPLQCAAEEIAFRGFIMQLFGTWIGRNIPALAVSIVVSAVAFSTAHGSFDPVVLADLAMMAVVLVLLTWRTGGLEAAIAIHVANNVVIFVLDALEGESQSIISSNTTATWESLVVSALMLGITAAVQLWAARRLRLASLTDPSQRPTPTVNYLHREWERGRIYPQWRHLYPPEVAATLDTTLAGDDRTSC